MGWFGFTGKKTQNKITHARANQRYHFFNETGNILISTHHDPKFALPEVVQQKFYEVSAFFGVMMKTISTTVNPETGCNYSFFNYHPLEKLLKSSGAFLKVSELDITVDSNLLIKENHHALFKVLLGWEFELNEISFASAIISSIGTEANRIANSPTQNEFKVSHIIFCCEYLAGIPIVTVIVLSIDCHRHKSMLNNKPCLNNSIQSTDFVIQKESFLFVSPQHSR